MPVRVQLSRRSGWRMPEDTVSVARPGRWGNPFNWQDCDQRNGQSWAKGQAVRRFRDWLENPGQHPDKPPPPTTKEIQEALRGKNLACWCSLSHPCHASVLLEIANGPLVCEAVDGEDSTDG